MGFVRPLPGFLHALRSLTNDFGALLIFDEVMTGFRIARGGAQAREGVLPDITTLGKVIGGGLPVGAFGGPAALMDRVTPDGDVFVSGTLSGNPVAMAAGIATLRLLNEGAYRHLAGLTERLCAGLRAAFRRHDVAHSIDGEGSMFGLFFAEGPVTELGGAKTSDVALYARFFHAMLERGYYFAPSQFEAAFVSLAHTESQIDGTIDAAGDALAEISACR
jgi:glutamate-1-semialdehyde 2,1-aminomutase